MGMKRPAFLFYPSDWRRELPLRTSSLAARGLLIELLCTMHDGVPYGHLSAVAGAPLSDEQGAMMVGAPLRQYRELLARLEASGVLSRTPEGVFFSRRMVRDEEKRTASAVGGTAQDRAGAQTATRPTNRKLQEHLLQRFGGCLACGSLADLDLYRIVPGRRHGKYEPGNVLLLCATHRKAGDRGTLTVDAVLRRCGVRSPAALFDATVQPIPERDTVSVRVSDTVSDTVSSDTVSEYPSSVAVAVAVSTNPSPPPGGGGVSPPPPSGGIAAMRETPRDAELPSAATCAVADVPHDAARNAIGRFLVEANIRSDRWERHIARFCGWRNGVSTSGRVPVSWPAIAEGLHEILDTNPTGQRIGPDQALSFVERAERRSHGGRAASHESTAPAIDASDIMRAMAIRHARNGDAGWQRFCHENSIPFSEDAVA